MASMAVEPCPYCLQITNQGQQPYGPICDNGHRAHLNCIMNQFESNRTFNINTWTCPLCRQPAYNPPLNDALRERFPRRIAALEGVPLMAPVDYLSEGESEEEPDDSQGAFDAYAEALPANETPEAENRINQLITHFPFLGTNYRSEEQDAINSIMDGLTQSVRMLGVFPESAQFQSTVDAGEMGAILMQQWYNIWNMTSAYEGDAEMEEVHSSMTNQSEFFQALTRAIIAGDRQGFWRLNAQQRLDLQVAINFIDPISHAMASLRRRGGKRKKKTRRKRRRGGVGSQPTTPRKGPHKKPPLPLKRPKITFWEKKYRGENEEGTTMNVMQHLTSMDLNDKEAEKEILEVLKYYLNDYKRIPENQQDPEFKKNLEKDVTIFQNYVNNQSGGKRRKKKTRKKRGGRFVDVTPEYIRENFDQLAGRKVELSEEGVPKKIIIYKLLDETGDTVDYKDIIPIPTFFYYINVDDNQDSQTPRLIGVIDLTEYGPGSIKINVANIQDGSGKRRKKKTRKKRGGWRRIDTDFNKDDIGYYYDCWNRDGKYDDVKYREGMTITGKWDVLRPISEWKILEMQDSHRYDPNLILYDESRPNFGTFRIPAQQLCSKGFKPLKRNDAKTGSGRKRKTRKKRGGMEEQLTPPRPPKDNDRGTNRYPPGFALPPPQVPVMPAAQPQQARMVRRRGSRERLRDRYPGARAPTQRMINELNEQLRRSQNSRVRNVTGDVLEACTGSRCGLGGRRKKKRKKKTRKKRGSHHEPLLLAAVAGSKLINKKHKKKYKKRRTKKKSRKR